MSGLPKSIIILGAAKSGTTALFYAIQNTLKTRHDIVVKGLFEPTEARKVREYLLLGEDPIPLVKMLLGPMTRKKSKYLESFDKRIVIFRDPRDNVVSRSIFMLARLFKPSEHTKISAVIDLLRRKERDPESLSVSQILKEVEQLAERENLFVSIRNNALSPAAIKRESFGTEYFMLPYEQFVEFRFEDLNRYLGLEVDPNFEVAENHNYVVRTKAAGSWKDWFLQEDIDFFVTEKADDYRLLGFDPDLKANACKAIDPKICSQYAEALFARMGEKEKGKKKKQKLRLEKKAAAEAAALSN